jgi:predicted RNA binding protein YcfA (HicA-like mRNA interferase family)
VSTVFAEALSKGDALPISGKEMLKRFQQAGWQIVNQRGSHVKVGKGDKRETIPMDKELKKGLEKSLLKRLESEE